jgi:hypothetical protein
MHMRVCYLHCHEAGLCCYLVIHTENLLHPFQMFYFLLWPVYWLSFVGLWMMNLKDLEGNSSCPIPGTIPEFAWRDSGIT